MVMHAARNYGVQAVGVTISREQYEFARKRVVDAGLNDRVEIRLEDYRDVHDGPYDAISSIGMFEHVGERRLATYMAQAMRLLTPRGRFLNHAITRPTGPKGGMDPDGFVNRYVFPDGELLELGQIISAMHATGLEVRHAETLREHYDRTLRHWVHNLESRWDEAVAEVGPARARIWRLYMAGSALAFAANQIEVQQVLAVRPDGGKSGMPSRPDW
jgi:cyclopropane-fatty-acyl-phospholipid synthase